MAKTMGMSVSTVQKIWRAHGLAPHRLRQFKLSNAERRAAAAFSLRRQAAGRRRVVFIA
jgi:hypothetical protein